MQATGLDDNAPGTGAGSPQRQPWAHGWRERRSRGVALRWAACVGLLGVMSCSAEDAPAPPPAGCDPLTREGCVVGEKCSIRVDSESPYLATVGCVPNGNQVIGGLCGFGDPGRYGYDNCQAGSFCLDGLCTPVCALDGADCTAGEQACTAHGGVFDGRDLGLCTALCEPVAMNSCASGQGCYLGLGTGRSTCHAAGSLGQGEVCAYIDDCSEGLGCVLLGADGASTVCTAFCDPATAVTSSGQTCAQALGAQAGTPACIAINRFYSDTPEVSNQVGMCLDCADPGYADLAVCSSAARLAR
jgi:hypothetical protein